MKNYSLFSVFVCITIPANTPPKNKNRPPIGSLLIILFTAGSRHSNHRNQPERRCRNRRADRPRSDAGAPSPTNIFPAERRRSAYRADRPPKHPSAAKSPAPDRNRGNGIHKSAFVASSVREPLLHSHHTSKQLFFRRAVSGLPRNSAAIPAFRLSCPTKKSSVLAMRSFKHRFFRNSYGYNP